MRNLPVVASFVVLGALVGGRSGATTVDPTLFAFPGAPTSPPSAASAGVALADRWLGGQPFGNPALEAPRGAELSPAIVHISRQDLRAANRNFDEQSAFFD